MQTVKTKPKVDATDDHLVIRRAYRRLLRSIPAKMDELDRKNIRMAYEMAVKAHSQQRRKSGEPYILHPIEVARICAVEIGLGPTAIIGALLHDVVEDTDVTLEEIHEKFGGKIARIVDGLTKLKSIYNPQQEQAQNFKKVLSSLAFDVRVALIKMADRLHNMRTISSMPVHKQLKIAAETSYIYAPLAHRLGLYNFRTEYQDLCMKVTQRDEYDEIARKLQVTKRERNQYIDAFIKPLSESLDALNIDYRILGRPKSISSIYNKIKTKNVPFEEIYDLFAVRIIIDVPVEKEKPLCWQVYSIVTDVHRPIPERLKDWITLPKSNGYESLHTTVVGPGGRYVEVQIRSERMDEIAERGFAAHWKYKGVSKTPDVYDVWLQNIREILEDVDKDALEFVNDFKTNLFNEEVFVFSPKGDMFVLPAGATALDFAFQIHSDVGYHATAIKVNNKLVPMGYKLTNGDQLTVITNKSQRPTESWLKMVVTSKAKSKIKSAIKEEKRKAGELGKEALERKLHNLKLDYDSNVDFLVKHFQFNNRPDLYFAIANGKIDIKELNKFPVKDGVFSFEKEVKEPKTPKTPKKEKPNTSLLLINDEPGDQYDYSLAKCCQPVKGDLIFAFIGTNSGVKIHRTSCPNAENLISNYGYRLMRAEWVGQSSSDFKVDFVVTGIDDGVGVLERITNTLSTLGINIRSLNIEGNEGYFEATIGLIVGNTNQMNMAMQSLKNMECISSVVRLGS